MSEPHFRAPNGQAFDPWLPFLIGSTLLFSIALVGLAGILLWSLGGLQ